MKAIQGVQDDVCWNHSENLDPDDEVTHEEFARLLPAHEVERSARVALATRIADELSG